MCFAFALIVHGQKGLREIEHQTSRWTERFSVEAEDDGKSLQCIVVIPGLGNNVASVKVKVKCKFNIAT